MKSISKNIIALFALILMSSGAFAQKQVDTTMIVNGVCGMCETTIENAAQIKGVSTADWDVETKVLTLSYNSKKTSIAKINRAINEAGYDTEMSTAGDEAYNNLHGCCKYRDPAVVEDHKTPETK
jgi:copper chaperone CopZ